MYFSSIGRVLLTPLRRRLLSMDEVGKSQADGR